MNRKHLFIAALFTVVILGIGVIACNHKQSEDPIRERPTSEVVVPEDKPIINADYEPGSMENQRNPENADGQLESDEMMEQEFPEDTEENSQLADLYKFKGDTFSDESNISAAIAAYEISLQYRKDPEVMYKTAELYRNLQKIEGDGCSYFWNFDRATQLYFETYAITGDCEPVVSFCEYCDEYIIDPTMTDGYKEKLLEHNNIEVVFVKNSELKEGEYIYHPDFDINGGIMTIETHELPAWELYESEQEENCYG